MKCNEKGFCKELKAHVPKVFCKTRCPKMPGMASMAKTFTKAVAKHVASGLKTREKKEIRRIIAICQDCEHYTNGRCRKCGCNMKKKIQWATTNCKLGKW